MRNRAAFVLACLLVPVGCRADKLNMSGGYMSRSAPGNLSYLHVTQAGKDVKGYLQQLVLNPALAAGYDSSRDEIEGIVSGNQVTLKIGGFFNRFGQREMDGTYSGGKLQLGYPMRDGTILKLSFTPTSVDAWNLAVAAFKKQSSAKATALRAAAAAIAARQARERHSAEVARQFDSAEQAILGTVPRLMTSLYREDQATSERPALVRAVEDAKKRVQELQTRMKELEEQGQKAAERQDRDEFKRLQDEAKEVIGEGRRVIEDGGAKQRKFEENEERLREAANEASSAWRELNSAFTNAYGARQEAGRCGFKLLELQTPIGNAGYVRADSTQIYRKPDEAAKAKTLLKQGEILSIVANQSGFFGFMHDSKFGWVKAADVALADEYTNPPAGASSRPNGVR